MVELKGASMDDIATVLFILLLLAGAILVYKERMTLNATRILLLLFAISTGIKGYSKYTEYIKSTTDINYGCYGYNSLTGVFFYSLLSLFALAVATFPTLLIKSGNLINKIEEYNRQCKLAKTKPVLPEDTPVSPPDTKQDVKPPTDPLN